MEKKEETDGLQRDERKGMIEGERTRKGRRALRER